MAKDCNNNALAPHGAWRPLGPDGHHSYGSSAAIVVLVSMGRERPMTVATFLRGRPRPIFALAEVSCGAGATTEEPPWFCGQRTSSDTRSDRPCHWYGLIPVTVSRIFMGWLQLKITLRALLNFSGQEAENEANLP